MDDFNILGHLIIGACLAVFVTNSPEEMIFVLFGSMLPDIDHQQSTLGRYNPFARYMKHRGHCHSLIGAVLLCLPVYFLGGMNLALLVFYGCIGHILGDRVYALFPKRKKFKLKIW